MNCIVLFSGGIDSSVLAKKCITEGRRVTCITLLCKKGAGNHDEVAAAETVAGILGLNHRTIDLSGLGSLFRDETTVMAVGGQINNCCNRSSRGVSLGVELMHLIGCVAALESNVSTIMWGLHADDFSDESEKDHLRKYIDLLTSLVELRTGKKISFETPFIHMKKVEVVALGNQLGVPLEMTISCVQPVDGKPCSACAQCHVRENAMSANSAVLV